MLRFDNEGDQILYAKAQKAGQKHLFQFWNELDSEQRRRFLDQIQTIDFQQLSQLTRLLEDNLNLSDSEIIVQDLRPAEFIEVPESPEEKAREAKAAEIGEALIAAGKVAAFVVAGGQGTRLGWDAPKGTYPVSPIEKKSLFQLFAEQIQAWNLRYNIQIPWFIMCSPSNRQETEDFFKEHKYFGLSKLCTRFIVQRQLPVVNSQGAILLENKGRMATSPDGHGGALTALEDAGGMQWLKERGVEHLSYFQVDNPLCKVLDPVFLGYHMLEESEASSKVVSKVDPWEKVGVLGYSGPLFRVIEYTELTDEDRMLRDVKGRLAFRGGSIANHVFKLDFLARLVGDHEGLPYHLAHKKVTTIDEDGDELIPEEANGYKFERFIFDTLSEAKNPCSLEVRREHQFEPLKNKDGANSAATVHRALVEYYAAWFEAAGVEVPRDEAGQSKVLCEVSALTAMTLEEFCRKVAQGLVIREQDGNLYA